MPLPPDNWSDLELQIWWESSGHYMPIYQDPIAQMMFHNGWFEREMALYNIRDIRAAMDEYMANTYGLRFSSEFFDWAAWRQFMGYT